MKDAADVFPEKNIFTEKLLTSDANGHQWG